MSFEKAIVIILLIVGIVMFYITTVGVGVAEVVKTDTPIVDNKSNELKNNDYATIQNVGFLKSDFISMDQYSTAVYIEEFDNKTVVEKALFSTGEYKVTLRFSKKGQVFCITTEGGNKFEWASNKNDEIITERIRFSASDLGSLELYSGDGEGDVKIDIQKL